MDLKRKIRISDDELKILVDNVNPTRLKNYPYELSKDEIKNIYLNIKE